MLENKSVKEIISLIKKKDVSVKEIVGLYWHFVDVVWIFIFTVIYLVPSPTS